MNRLHLIPNFISRAPRVLIVPVSSFVSGVRAAVGQPANGAPLGVLPLALLLSLQAFVPGGLLQPGEGWHRAQRGYEPPQDVLQGMPVLCTACNSLVIIKYESTALGRGQALSCVSRNFQWTLL